MSDPRFARLKSDPRFRRPKKKQQKVVVDERFKSLFAQEKGKRTVDKYGRTVSDRQGGDDLRRYYRLETDEVQDAEGGEAPKRPDYARGEVLLESSDEEDEDDTKAIEDDDDEDDGLVTLGADSSHPIPVRNDAELEIDLDEDNYADLDAQAAQYAKNAQEEEDDADEALTTDRTRRLAIVNLDWDHVRAHHLYKICASLVSPTAPSVVKASSSKKNLKGGRDVSQVTVVRGKVLSVRVYPSNFGKERMAKEEKEGPPPEIFKRSKELEADEINEKNIYEVGGEEEYDEDALRKYQLERLRYYYAIVECDTVEAASHIYNELEGTELERSANVFNMSFVPDDMVFENELRDEATDESNANYKAVEFVTDALRHSKVKLTWDEDDPERTKVTRRALTKQEIEENDFRAYIATSSSEDEEEDSNDKQKKKKASRDRLRGLLLGGNKEEMPEGWGDGDNDSDVDLEVTFTPGLSAKANEEETTLEQYQRKLREKRKKRKESMKEKKAEDTQQADEPDDEFFDKGSGQSAAEDDDNDDAGPRRGKKDKKGKKPQDAKASSSRPEMSAEELALLVDSGSGNGEPKHFNLKSVLKAEKQKKNKHRKKRKGDKDGEDNEAQEDFTIDVKDERFKALHEDHQFAIDPTNPHFKKTKGMQAFLEERQKRQRDKRGDEFGERAVKASGGRDGPSPQEGKDNSLQGLVESVKRKSSEKGMSGQGKRRKLQ